jgi:hypothetical protein
MIPFDIVIDFAPQISERGLNRQKVPANIPRRGALEADKSSRKSIGCKELLVEGGPGRTGSSRRWSQL